MKMNFVTIGIGLLPCAYAIYVLILRIKGKNDLFRKLGPMKKTFGNKLGSAIHYFGYVIVPMGFGVFVIYLGMKGLNLADALFS